MYFKDRAEAGTKLAAELTKYRYDNCAVVALSDSAALVAEQIAIELHAIMTILLTKDIEVPGENIQFGTVIQNGAFVYNDAFSTGELEAYYGEFHGYLDDQKREKFQEINQLLGDGGILNQDILRDHVVILVSDGLSNGMSLTAAAEFLKPIKINKLVVAVPVASVAAVDRMHVLADELHVLSVTDNYLDTNHYYDNNVIPSHEETIARINNIVLQWK